MTSEASENDKIVSGCRQVISTFDSFSSFIAADFNLDLQKFVESHYLITSIDLTENDYFLESDV